MDTKEESEKKPEDTATRLKQLGLSVDLLVRAIQVGEVARNSCTPNDPAALPGFLAWGRTTRALRDELVPQGWKREEDGGLALVVSPDGSMAIAVATGDANTASPTSTPRTKYPRGNATIVAVQENRKQLRLFERNDLLPAPVSVPARKTWSLLFARSGTRVRAELSLASSVDEQGHVDDWAERILLPAFDVDEAQFDESADDELDIDVNVSRRDPEKKEPE